MGSLACVSVGYLVHEDAQAKTITPHIADPEDDAKACGLMVIPNGADHDAASPGERYFLRGTRRGAFFWTAFF